MDDAGIACQQMGNYTHNSSGVLQVTLQTSISSVYMSNFDCNHNEGLGNNLLKDCKSDIGDANTEKFATASCIEAECRNGDVKMDDNSVLFICYNGKWNTICGQHYSWTIKQSQVACRNLGLNPIGAKVVIQATNTELGNFPVFNFRFNCDGSEHSLASCSRTMLNGNERCTSKSPLAKVSCEKWPREPEDLVPSFIQDSQFELKWVHHINDKESDVDFYEILCGFNDKLMIFTTNKTSTNITDLTPNTQYHCCISAMMEYTKSKPACINITTTQTAANRITDGIHWIAVSALIGLATGTMITLVLCIIAAKIHIKKLKDKSNNPLPPHRVVENNRMNKLYDDNECRFHMKPPSPCEYEMAYRQGQRPLYDTIGSPLHNTAINN
jgi:hypothetical protein